MGAKQKKLIKKAVNKYKKIFPCGGKTSFSECFTKESDNNLYFWFDTEDCSTHVEVDKRVKQADYYKAFFR